MLGSNHTCLIEPASLILFAVLAFQYLVVYIVTKITLKNSSFPVYYSKSLHLISTFFRIAKKDVNS